MGAFCDLEKKYGSIVCASILRHGTVIDLSGKTEFCRDELDWNSLGKLSGR